AAANVPAKRSGPKHGRPAAQPACSAPWPARRTFAQEPTRPRLRNELAMPPTWRFLSVLDDERQPVYHAPGRGPKRNKGPPAGQRRTRRDRQTARQRMKPGNGGGLSGGSRESNSLSRQQPPELQRLESARNRSREWSLRCKLAQRWLEGATASQAASPFASLARRSGPASSRTSRTSATRPPAAAAGPAPWRPVEVFVSDSEEDDEGRQHRPGGCGGKSEMTFYNCAVHGVEVPESFVRVKFKGGGGGGARPRRGK
uniref:MBD domain-containing protein n=1 Tax=Macrostomum lignano TaxID=282301 RepID=A0A1I8F467_9PLAT